MSRTQAVDPNAHDIADRVKLGYAEVTQLLGAAYYRLAELADTGRLDPDELPDLQDSLFLIWEDLCVATLHAVVPNGVISDDFWEDSNTYSDGRRVVTQVLIEGEDWELIRKPNDFLDLDRAANPGTIYYIASTDPDGGYQVDYVPKQVGS